VKLPLLKPCCLGPSSFKNPRSSTEAAHLNYRLSDGACAFISSRSRSSQPNKQPHKWRTLGVSPTSAARSGAAPLNQPFQPSAMPIATARNLQEGPETTSSCHGMNRTSTDYMILINYNVLRILCNNSHSALFKCKSLLLLIIYI
jgi:hypothetical protein